MTLSSLEERLRRLERRSRAWSVTAVSALCLLLLTAIDRSQDEVLAAERFELVDDKGRLRAEIGIDEDGSAGFFVLDLGGRVRASVTHDDAQAAMYLRDEAGTIRVGAAQFAHGGGGFALHGDESKRGAVL